MRIGVNLTGLTPDRVGGLEHYVRRVLDGLLQESDHDFVLFASPSAAPTFTPVPGRREVREVPATESDGLLMNALDAAALDVWWCPWVVLRPMRASLPTVYTVPDLQHERYPENFDPEELRQRRAAYFIAAHTASAIITFSRHTRDDVVDVLGVEAGRVHPIPLDVGYDWTASEPTPELLAELEARHGTGFLYYPANTWPHKDHRLLLQAMRSLADRGTRLRLVLTASGTDDRGRVEAAVRELGLDEQVTSLGTVAPPVVRGLYRLALALVFPSRFEGFGMPVLEAMRSGTPVLCSDATSLPEVGGDAASYFKAGDLESLVQALGRLAGDADFRAERIAAGHARQAGFSWASTARATADVFVQAASAPALHTSSAEALSLILDSLAAVEKDRAARQAQLESVCAERLDLILRMAALAHRLREEVALARPNEWHGLATPFEVVRLRRAIRQALATAQQLAPEK